jgi:hypothetical protein
MSLEGTLFGGGHGNLVSLLLFHHVVFHLFFEQCISEFFGYHLEAHFHLRLHTFFLYPQTLHICLFLRLKGKPFIVCTGTSMVFISKRFETLSGGLKFFPKIDIILSGIFFSQLTPVSSFLLESM